MKPILVLKRNEPSSQRVFDWIKRNGVADVARAYFLGDTTSDQEIMRIMQSVWHNGATIPNLFTENTWVKGEQSIKDALWRLQQTVQTDLIAYVSRTCGACQTFLRLLASQPKLLARTQLRELEKDMPRYTLEMHDLKAFKTPTLVQNTAQGQQVFQGQQALAKLVELA